MKRVFEAFAENFKVVAAAGLCAVVLAGCGGAENAAGAFISAGQKPIEVSADTFRPPVYCPALQLQPNSHLIMRHVRGKENEPGGLLYQATIVEWASDCSREGSDQTRIKIGLSGHVTPGPAWQGGDIDLPIRLEIVPGSSDAKPLVSEAVPVKVSVGAGSPRVAWTWVENKYVVERDRQMAIKFGFVERR